MIYSRACEYAILGLTVLADRPRDTWTLRSEIAETAGLPYPFAGKILQDLVRAGLLESVRGRGGGYRLAKAPEDIHLIDIRRAIDGTDDLDACAVGLDPCSDETPCPLHHDFKRVRETIREYLTATTLAQVAGGRREKGARLARGE
ncbi:MAG: Rrf2 family transcriptional regulator [Gemmatimonadota bacterium]|nr:Rrf2 family transcriptional regulator [Gemmatimonadota bacterium]